MRQLFTIILLAFVVFPMAAQQKKLDHDALHRWRRIQDRAISQDGNYISYSLKANVEANDILKLKKHNGSEVLTYERGTQPQLSFDSKYLFFTIKHDVDSVKAMRRRKVKKDDLPKDSLAIYHIPSGQLVKHAGLKSVKYPEKWSGWLAYQYEPIPDSTAKKKPKPKAKKGEPLPYPLVVQSADGKNRFEFPQVLSYSLAEKGERIAFVSKGDSTFLPGVYIFDAAKQNAKPIFRSKGKYYSLTWDEQGNQLSFVSDLDTTKARLRKPNLHFWASGSDSANVVMDASHTLLGDTWLVSEHFKQQFSEDGSKLYFGLKTYPILPDTSLLKEEIVNVEVWHYEDPLLHTQQKINKKEDEKKAYASVYHIKQQKFLALASSEMPEVLMSPSADHSFGVGLHSESYSKLICHLV